jgi:branched-chain amino acid transport system ATP-binding protein
MGFESIPGGPRPVVQMPAIGFAKLRISARRIGMDGLQIRCQPIVPKAEKLRIAGTERGVMGALELDRVSKRFGGLMAVKELSLTVETGEIRGLIGPNGAGKTTVFNLISGFYRPTAGRILYQEEDIAGLRTCHIAERGIVRTFQHTTLFEQLSVLANVLVGCHLRSHASTFASLLGRDHSQRSKYEAEAKALLEFFGLADRADDIASSLPHGLQKTLGLAVAVAAEPKILMLDEPFAGMNTQETSEMMGVVRRLRDRGMTVLLVEHDMQAVMGLCDRITVMNFGELLTEGTPAEVRANPAVIEAYLGHTAVADA